MASLLGARAGTTTGTATPSGDAVGSGSYYAENDFVSYCLSIFESGGDGVYPCGVSGSYSPRTRTSTKSNGNDHDRDVRGVSPRAASSLRRPEGPEMANRSQVPLPVPVRASLDVETRDVA